MSLTAACLWTLLRSLLIAAAVLPFCHLLRRLLVRTRGVPGKLAWALMLAPLFFPELLTGYAYRNYSLSLVHYPAWNVVLYSVLMALKLVGVGTVVLYFSPPPAISAEALHCHRLAFRAVPSPMATSAIGAGLLRRMMHLAPLVVRSRVRESLAAFAIVYLLAFGDFEMASLMEFKSGESWTIGLLDAHARNLPAGESLSLALLPALCELCVFLPVLLLVLGGGRLSARPIQHLKGLSRPSRVLVWSLLVFGVLAVCIVPLRLLGGSTIKEFLVLFQSHQRLPTIGLFKQIFVGGSFALIAAIVAYVLAGWFVFPRASKRSQRTWTAVAVVFCIPGLLGGMVLGLTLMFVFLQDFLYLLYDTPLPLVVGLVLFLLPRAVLLQLLLRAMRAQEPLHLAGLLQDSPLHSQQDQGHELAWRMKYNGHFWAIVLIAFWAYMNLTIPSLLAPAAMVLAPVDLYNQMHYGRIPLLSAKVGVMIGVPVLLLVVAASLKRYLLRWLFG